MEQNPHYNNARHTVTSARYGETHRATPYVQMRSISHNARMSASSDDCGCDASVCGKASMESKQLFMPAMAYVPDHAFENILPMETAFCVGTIFGCLHLPFTGKEVR